jgi:glycerol transport system ATP-binding protein
VAAILFDEPLTVIDPHLKWQLRRKLKQVHQELKHTLIYVTHDQVEALTFAQEVVVMTRGRAVQVGNAEALFERPAHSFVGHFIGSPGMNFLPAKAQDTLLHIGGHTLTLSPAQALALAHTQDLKLGVRPEYIGVHDHPAPGCLPAQVVRWQDLGTRGLLTTQCGAEVVRVRLAHQSAQPPAVGQTVYLQVLSIHTCFYEQEALIA